MCTSSELRPSCLTPETIPRAGDTRSPQCRVSPSASLCPPATGPCTLPPHRHTYTKGLQAGAMGHSTHDGSIPRQTGTRKGATAHLSTELGAERIPCRVVWRASTLTRAWQGAVKRGDRPHLSHQLPANLDAQTANPCHHPRMALGGQVHGAHQRALLLCCHLVACCHLQPSEVLKGEQAPEIWVTREPKGVARSPPQPERPRT